MRCLRRGYLNISLLRGQTDWAFRASLGVLVGKLEPSVPVLSPHPTLFPCYLTLIKHYRAQQRVHRANSYPPELAFLQSQRRSCFVFFEENKTISDWNLRFQCWRHCYSLQTGEGTNRNAGSDHTTCSLCMLSWEQFVPLGPGSPS